MIKEDCAMYRERIMEDGTLNKFCDGLKELYCVREKCRFFKTRELLAEQKRQRKIRLGEIEE